MNWAYHQFSCWMISFFLPKDITLYFLFSEYWAIKVIMHVIPPRYWWLLVGVLIVNLSHLILLICSFSPLFIVGPLKLCMAAWSVLSFEFHHHFLFRQSTYQWIMSLSCNIPSKLNSSSCDMMLWEQYGCLPCCSHAILSKSKIHLI